MSSKKNNSRPTKTNASPGAPRRAGSPVEAARKSFVVEDAGTANDTAVTEAAPKATAAAPVRTASATTPAAKTTPGSLKNAPQVLSSRRQAQLERKKRRQRQQIITWSIIGVVIL